MFNIGFKLNEEKIIELQSFKGRIKLNFYQHLGNYYDEMKFEKQLG